MTETKTTTYEGMFLFSQSAGANLQDCVDHVTELLDRAGATTHALSKWDERRLAYEIKGSKRGIYFLAYFDVESEKLAGLERNCNLSEKLLRAMVTRADHLPAEHIEAADGREALRDEIKFRGTEAAAAEAGSTGTATATAPPEPATAPDPAPAEDASEEPATPKAPADG